MDQNQHHQTQDQQPQPPQYYPTPPHLAQQMVTPERPKNRPLTILAICAFVATLLCVALAFGADQKYQLAQTAQDKQGYGMVVYMAVGGAAISGLAAFVLGIVAYFK